jgi:hypothetical protein
VGKGSSSAGVKLSEAATDTSPAPSAANDRLALGGTAAQGMLLRASEPALAGVKVARSSGVGAAAALAPPMPLLPRGTAATASRTSGSVLLVAAS